MSASMFGLENLPLFVTTGILLNLIPGQDTLYIVGRSLAEGRRAGFLSVFGIASGSVVHTLAAAFGLSALLAASPAAFLAVRWGGAAYLAYVGIRMLLQPAGGADGPPDPARKGSWAVYRDGFLTNLLNPKVALFYIAFLPQFVSPASDHKVLAFLFLGAVFMGTGTTWSLIVAWCASGMSRRFRERTSAGVWLRRAAGGTFVGLGLKMAAGR